MSGFCATPRDALASTATQWGSSRCTELQRCEVAYALRYERGITPKRKAVYFDVGSYVHGSLRWVNEGVIAGERRDWRDVIAAATEARAEAEAAGTATPLEWDDEDPIAEAERLVSAYYALNGDENGGWPEQVKLRHVELAFSSAEIRATACADLVVELGGEIILPDTKTRARGLPADRYGYELDLQTNEEFLRLSALAQRHFELDAPPPIWLDAIIKTKVAKVDRLLVRFRQDQIDRWWDNAERLEDAEFVAAQNRKRGHLPIMNLHECAPFAGARCWAFHWCHGTEETREMKFKVKESVAT